jgi:tyrosyl-tRNA synthetase
VALKSDIELGGTDQKFNLLVGRDMQRSFNQPPQVIIMMPILEGLDGVDKMSKSLNNYVGINEPPDEMFGKLMSISDTMMWRYYELLTDVDYKALRDKVESGELHPKKVKSDLAFDIVAQYHGKEAAAGAMAGFESVFTNKGLPEDIETFSFSEDRISVVDMLKKTGLASSGSDARRLIGQGAVSVDGKRIDDINATLELDKGERVIKVGKRRFARITRS